MSARGLSAVALAALAAALGSAADIPPAGGVQFQDVTAAAAIVFRHDSGAFGKKYLPETMGSGVALFDYDNDGWLDVFLANGGSADGT